MQKWNCIAGIRTLPSRMYSVRLPISSYPAFLKYNQTRLKSTSSNSDSDPNNSYNSKSSRISTNNNMNNRVLEQIQETMNIDSKKYEALMKTVKPVQANDAMISCTIIDENGNVTAVSKQFPKTKFLAQFKLFPRDLRNIDSSSVDVSPIIAVRSNCILINLLHIKALIQHDQVLVFDTYNPMNAKRLGLFMYDLELKLRTKIIHGSATNQSYEFRALESILINVMAYLETELQQNLENCTSILQDLETNIDRNKLKDLLVHSKQLKTFYQKSLLIKNVLDELLDNDDDLEAMYLTENNQLRESMNNKDQVHGTVLDAKTSKMRNYLTIFDDNSELDTDEIEMLLESYYKQCDEIVQQADSLISDIRSTEDIVNIILDANRNSLMVFELKIGIYTLAITMATLLPAFYGMNLKNYIEESEFAFGGVVGLSMIMGILMVVYGSRKLGVLQRLTMMSGKNSSSTYKMTLEELQKEMANQAVVKREAMKQSQKQQQQTQYQKQLKQRQANNHTTNTSKLRANLSALNSAYSKASSHLRESMRQQSWYRRQIFRDLWRFQANSLPRKSNARQKDGMFKWIKGEKEDN